MPLSFSIIRHNLYQFSNKQSYRSTFFFKSVVADHSVPLPSSSQLQQQQHHPEIHRQRCYCQQKHQFSTKTSRRQRQQQQEIKTTTKKTKNRHHRAATSRRNKKDDAVYNKPAIRPPKDYLKKLPKPKEKMIPPALLSPTASPYVYISRTALVMRNSDDGDDDGTGPTLMDTSTLFGEVATSPSPSSASSSAPLFYNMGTKYEFEYFSPKADFNHEYPIHNKPEVMFLGRSNVGKSSLINNIIQKDLCITSKSPGRTQLPYYYGLIPKIKDKRNDTENIKKSIPLSSSKTMKKDPSTVQGYVVDLPGYGFGMAPKAVVDGWQQDTQDLLLHRRHEAKVLQRLFLLMDARRGEPNEIDRTVMRWLEDAEIPYTIVLTKADRVSLPLVVKQVNDFCVRYASQHHHHDEEEVGGVAQSPIVHITSSKQGWGVQELRLSIEAEFFPEDKDDQYHSDHEDCQQ